MKSPAVHRLRLVSVPEGISWLVLIVCTVLKYTTSFNAVPVMGPIHGCLFILYVLFLLDCWKKHGWEFSRVALLFVQSILPTGAFFAERWLARQEQGAPEPSAVEDAAAA